MRKECALPKKKISKIKVLKKKKEDTRKLKKYRDRRIGPDGMK